MVLEDILIQFENSTEKSEFLLSKTLTAIIQSTDAIAHPAHGETYQRWQIFSRIAATNLTLAKCFESHCDALSILKELNIAPVRTGIWAVWAAEGSQKPLQCTDLICDGEKLWCSGAAVVDYGLMTYKDTEKRTQLCMVDMHQTGIVIDHANWQAVGMRDTATAKIIFNQVSIYQVGSPNDYLSRVGFWHGAAGVAACWFGATTRIASFLEAEFKRKVTPFNAMYWGEVCAHLTTIKQLFKNLALSIDQQPTLSHEFQIRILRFQVEQAAKQVMDLVGNALGARPFCEDAVFAQLSADLPVFLRQSHAAYDLENIAKLSVQSPIHDQCRQEQHVWML